MTIDTSRNPLSVYRRIGLWLCSFLISVLLFALVASLPTLLSIWSEFTAVARAFVYYLILMTIYALMVSVVYVPFLVAFKDAAQRRLWIILISATLVGPCCLVVLSFILTFANGEPLASGDVHRIWRDEGPGIGIDVMPFAFGLNLVTAILYVAALRSKTLLFREKQADRP
jgi:Na+-driven multidrug efflux pump